jgi:ABC-type nitrate/sulfonate/bicarbonate transport system substrate-binding protein
MEEDLYRVGARKSSSMERRRFLRGLCATGLGLAFGGLVSRAADAPSLGQIAYQLSWVKNFQFAGSYFAETKNYYRQYGVDVDLLAGGPNLSADPIVVSGKALVGQSSPDFMCNAVGKGAALTCIGANYQRTVFCMISMSKTPLNNPHDMIGKKIGIQTNNLVIWRAFLKLNHIPVSSIQVVPVQFDFTPLISGEVDGFFGYANDDVIQIKNKGFDIHYFLFADYGYKMLNATYSVLTESLADKSRRAQLVAFMRGEIRGWQDALKDPALSAKLNVFGQGNGLDLKGEEASCAATTDFIVDADTPTHGLFWMSPASISETITTLAAGGVKATPDMFTNAIIEEAYQGKTTL